MVGVADTVEVCCSAECEECTDDGDACDENVGCCPSEIVDFGGACVGTTPIGPCIIDDSGKFR